MDNFGLSNFGNIGKNIDEWEIVHRQNGFLESNMYLFPWLVYMDAIPATEKQAHCAKTRCVGWPNILAVRILRILEIPSKEVPQWFIMMLFKELISMNSSE